MFIGSSTEGREFVETIQIGLQEDVEATPWNKGVFGLGDSTLYTLVESAARFDFAVLVLTPDDMIISRGQEMATARDNVLFELGLFMGALGRERTFVVRSSPEVKLPSDFAGITYVDVEQRADANTEAAVTSAVRKIRQAVSEASPRPLTTSGLTQTERAARERQVEEPKSVAGAKTILTAELREAKRVLQEEILEPGEWPAGREPKWQEAWQEYRGPLAESIGDGYDDLARAFNFASRLQDGLRTGPRPFIPSDPPFLEQACHAIDRGAEVLSG
jgi:Predicted nucleotide-binding protein containing TIR-like domain